MLPVYVALVPYETDTAAYRVGDAGGVPFQEDLHHVCAALQTQVTRDFAPLWGISAVVSPFTSLEHVPVGYVPLVIVPPGRLRSDGMVGFHQISRSRPFALIEYGPGWSLLASHELLEVVVDPLGTRTLRGTSIVDEKNLDPRPHSPPDYPDQGQVEYLVEICDPCQQSTYTINGVLVSDFVTPEYYGPFHTTGARYCFTGLIDGPRKVLEGGYVSWCTPHDHFVWQAFAPETADPRPAVAEFASLSIIEIGVLPSFTRESVDSATHPDRPDVAGTFTPDEPLRPAEAAYEHAMHAAQHHGRRWRTDLAPFVQSLPVPAPSPVDAEVIRLLEILATSEVERTRFQEHPDEVLGEHGIAPTDLELWKGHPVPPKSRYDAILQASRRDPPKRFGPDVNNDQTAPWMMGLIHG